jgi:hypothetical protein
MAEPLSFDEMRRSHLRHLLAALWGIPEQDLRTLAYADLLTTLIAALQQELACQQGREVPPADTWS